MIAKYHTKDIYIPRTKYDLAETLAKRYFKKESEKPEHRGETEKQVYDFLYRRFIRKKKKELYAIYFKPINKLRETKPSKLEEDVREIQKQDLQGSLF